jgi:hypothetical protein
MKLAFENKVGRYMRYAIGEILLVVIGILLALQINTWKKETQNRKLEKTYLMNLRADLFLQQEINDVQTEYELNRIAEANTAISFIGREVSLPDLTRLLDSLSARHTFVANNVTFDNLGKTGNVVHIRNAEILNNLIRYDKVLDYTKMVINNNNLVLIDEQFGKFVNFNKLGISMDTQGEVTKIGGFSGEERYLLFHHLKRRKMLSEGIIELVHLLSLDTQTLIESIDIYLR